MSKINFYLLIVALHATCFITSAYQRAVAEDETTALNRGSGLRGLVNLSSI